MKPSRAVLAAAELRAFAALLTDQTLSAEDRAVIGGVVEALQQFAAAPVDGRAIDARLEAVEGELMNAALDDEAARVKLRGAAQALRWLCHPDLVETPSHSFRGGRADPSHPTSPAAD